jgi:hypothetical protein
MKLKIFLFALCLMAFGATMFAQPLTVPVTAKEIKTVVVKGITYTTAKPPATVESLTKNCTDTGVDLVCSEGTFRVWETKPTKKYPEGRMFYVQANTKGIFSRKYLSKQ